MPTDTVKKLIDTLLAVDEDDVAFDRVMLELSRAEGALDYLLALNPETEDLRDRVDEVLSRLDWDQRILERMEARFGTDGEMFVRHAWRLPDDDVVPALIAGLDRALAMQAPARTLDDLVYGIEDIGGTVPAELAVRLAERQSDLDAETRRYEDIAIRLAADLVSAKAQRKE